MLINKDCTYDSQSTIKLLILRISVIGLYLVAYRNIRMLSKIILEVPKHPIMFYSLIFETKGIVCFKEPHLKSFTLLILFSTTLIPVFRALLKEIDTDTIFFWFSICQIIFCVDSIKSSILNRKDKKQSIRRFKRTEVISLEESILIPRKNEFNGVFGSIAALVGFFGTFSRIDDNTQALILQAIGFIFYLFLPRFLENRNIHMDNRRFLLILCSFFIFQLIGDEYIFAIIFSITVGIGVSFIGVTHIIERYTENS